MPEFVAKTMLTDVCGSLFMFSVPQATTMSASSV
jgi:hypothetical protein